MKALILTAIGCLLTSSLSAQSDQLQALKDKKNFAIEAVTAPVLNQYVADLKKLLNDFNASKNWDEAKKVKEEIALFEEKASTNNSPVKIFNDAYMVGSNWEYFIGKGKYLIIFERKTYTIYKIDFRGRKVFQSTWDWKVGSIEDRLVVRIRGGVPMALNEDLTEIFTPIVPRGAKLRLLKK